MIGKIHGSTMRASIQLGQPWATMLVTSQTPEQKVAAKRLEMLRELVPAAARANESHEQTDNGKAAPSAGPADDVPGDRGPEGHRSHESSGGETQAQRHRHPMADNPDSHAVIPS